MASGRIDRRVELRVALAGPFDQWPVGMGFEYFYGFMGGETNAAAPDKPFFLYYVTAARPRGTSERAM